MNSPQPVIRNCPFCRVAMVGSRSQPDRREFDMFLCLNCDTVIQLDTPTARGETTRRRR
jgi:hypothetical protein